jgi:hypothetical protein
MTMAGKSSNDASAPASETESVATASPEIDVAKLASDLAELKATVSAVIEGVNGIRALIGDVEGVQITGGSVAEMLGTIGKFVASTAGVHL